MKKIEGLIAATYTPMDNQGNLKLSSTKPMVDRLVRDGVNGLYVGGSTGEGVSLNTRERMEVAQSFVEATNGRVPVIVQVGHNSVSEAKELSRHAQTVGANAFSATCPSYFSIASTEVLVETMAKIAEGAPDLPFYYYHIPSLTGSSVNMEEFLISASERIPNLAGIKYTDTKVFEFQRCVESLGGKLDCLWGCDEMILSALVAGGKGAVGSTYNLISPIYLEMMKAFESGDLVRARSLQSQAIEFVVQMARFPFHSAMKFVMNQLGWEVGVCRLPHQALTSDQESELKAFVQVSPFFERFEV